MRILVIGGSGLIGRQLVPHLLKQGHEVLVLSRGNRPIEAPGAQHAQADRKDPNAVRHAIDGSFDALIDNVAYVPEDGEGLLAALAGRIGHYILTSTAFVYPGVDPATKGPSAPLRECDAPPGALPEDEGDPSPHGRYVQGKRLLERRLQEICLDLRLPLTIVRPSLQLMGPYTEDGRFAWFWLRMQDGGPIWLPTSARLHAGPCQVGFSGDVARILAAAVAHPPKTLAVYNAAQPELWSYEEYLGLMAEILGREPDVRYAPREVLDRSPFAAQGVYRLPLPYRAAIDVSTAGDALNFTWTPMRTWMAATGGWVSRYYEGRAEPWYRLRPQELLWPGP